MNYKPLYISLFNEITKALDAIDKMNYGQARQILIAAQLHTEELYMASEPEMENTNSSPLQN